MTFVLLVANGSARVEYLALAAPALFAAGATWWESRGTAARVAVAALAIVLALPLMPFGLPCLSVPQYVAYQKALGLALRIPRNATAWACCRSTTPTCSAGRSSPIRSRG